MIKVKPNTFFLKNTPPSGSMIPITSEIGDLSLKANSELLEFSSGDVNKYYLISGNAQNNFTDGRYDMIGGYLRTYASGASTTVTGQPYNISIFAFKDDYDVSEGGLELIENTAAAPTEVIYSISYPQGGNILLQENFDGKDTSLNFQMGPISGYFGSDPYVWYEDAVEAYADKYLVTRKGAKKALKPYRTFDPRDSDVPQSDRGGNIGGDIGDLGFTFKGRVPRFSAKSNKPARIYLKKGSSRGGKFSFGVSSKYYYPKKLNEDKTLKVSSKIKIPRKQIEDTVQYGSMYEISVSNDSAERQTTNNTIFDSVFSSRMVHNPWNADVTNPLVYSELNLSNTEGLDGNAAKFYHSWGFASGSQGASGGKTAVEVVYGRSKDLNGQTTRASIYNIPLPLITDIGNDLNADNRNYSVSDRRTYFPEISMDMRIDKLGATPFYGIAQNVGKFSKAGMYTGSTANQALVYGLSDENGGVNELQSNLNDAIVDLSLYGNDKTESLLRNITITFSNYTPEEVNPTTSDITLDEFLNYGLNNFYIRNQTKHGIVGGVVLKTYGAISGDTGAESAANTGVSYPTTNTNDIYIQALPVAPKHDVNVHSNVQEKLFRRGGMVRLCDGAYDIGVRPDSSCSVTNNSTTVTVTSTAELFEGMEVAHQEPDGTNVVAGIVPGTTIESINSATQFSLSTNYTGTTASSQTLTFTNPDEYGGVSPQVTGDDYLLKIGVANWLDDYAALKDYDTVTEGRAAPTWSESPLWQKVGFNSFFKLRFFWDILAMNSDASYSNTPYSDLSATAPKHVTAATGPICRLIIEDEAVTSDTTLTENPAKKFIDIPFPVATLRSGATAGTAAGTYTNTTKMWGALTKESDFLNQTISDAEAAKLWPSCMTIWVNNYRYIVGGNNSRRETSILNGQADDYFYYGDASPTGIDQEVEMYLDNITFKDFTPEIDNHSRTNTLVDTWTIKPSSVSTPLYNITGTTNPANGDNQRRLISFNAVSGNKASAQNAAAFRELNPSQSLMFGWDDKADMPNSPTNGGNGYCLFSDFSTLNFNNLNQFNFPMWTNYAESGFISMEANVVTNDLNMLSHQYIGAHFISGAVYSQYGGNGTISSYNNLSGSLYEITDAGTIADNKMTIASGTNTFLSTDGFTQKGFAYISVSGNAGNNTAVDYGNWGKREHAAVSVKVIGFPGEDGLENNQIRVADTSIFNKFQNDEYMIYRAHSIDASSTKKTGIRLIDSEGYENNIVSFDKNLKFANNGTFLTRPQFQSEIYISPVKYWVTMNYPSSARYGNGSNNEQPTSRSYNGIAMVKGTPNSTTLSTYTGSTFNESQYTYNTVLTGTTGRSGMSNNLWDFELDEDESVFELNQDFGFGTYDPITSSGGEVDIKSILQSTYVDFNLSGPVQSQTITSDNTFLLMAKLVNNKVDGGIELYSPALASSALESTILKPSFYWEYGDLPPSTPEVSITAASDLLAQDVNLYELTNENLSAVKYNWDENDEDIWYRFIIMNTGSIANKYEGARLWIPLNEEAYNGRLDYYTNTYNVYDVVSGTSTTLTNGGNGMGSVPDVTGVVNSPFESRLHSDITGIAGYAPVFGNNSTNSQWAYLPSGGNFDFPMGSAAETTKFSIMAHATLVSGNSDQFNWILSKGVDSSPSVIKTGIAMLVSGANTNTPVVQVCHGGTYLTSTTPLPNDGSSFNVIYTYNSGSAIGPDAKLYVNGILEDYVNSCNALSTTDKNLFIGTAFDSTTSAIWKYSGSPSAANGSRTTNTYDGGGSGIAPSSTSGGGSNSKFTIEVAANGVATFTMISGGSGYAVNDTITFNDSTMGSGGAPAVVLTVTEKGTAKHDAEVFNGTIEELVFYNHVLEVPQNSGLFVYNTADQLNINSDDKLITHNSRLFLCDYHNIRGKSSKTITSSNQVSWRASI